MKRLALPIEKSGEPHALPAGIYTLVHAHPTLIGAALTIMLALVKIAVISDYSVTTMLAVANSVSAESVLFGLLLSHPYPLFLAVIVGLWIQLLLSTTSRRISSRFLRAISGHSRLCCFAQLGTTGGHTC